MAFKNALAAFSPKFPSGENSLSKIAYANTVAAAVSENLTKLDTLLLPFVSANVDELLWSTPGAAKQLTETIDIVNMTLAKIIDKNFFIFSTP